MARRSGAHNVTFMKQPLSVHPTYSVHIAMHFSLSMSLNRSRFLSAHCARIISRIIWLDTGPIQRFRTLAVSIFCVSVLRCLFLQSPSFFTLHGSEQVKISVRALCAHNLAHNMAGHGPHSATVKLSKGAHVQPMAPWQLLLIRNMEINAQSIMRGLLGNGTMLQNIMRGLCAPGFLLCATLCATLCAGRIYYARYYARRLQHCNTLCADYARLCFIMRGIMRNIMRGQLTLCAKCLFCTLPSLAVYAACPTPVQQPLLCPHTSWHG